MAPRSFGFPLSLSDLAVAGDARSRWDQAVDTRLGASFHSTAQWMRLRVAHDVRSYCVTLLLWAVGAIVSPLLCCS